MSPKYKAKRLTDPDRYAIYEDGVYTGVDFVILMEYKSFSAYVDVVYNGKSILQSNLLAYEQYDAGYVYSLVAEKIRELKIDDILQ